MGEEHLFLPIGPGQRILIDHTGVRIVILNRRRAAARSL